MASFLNDPSRLELLVEISDIASGSFGDPSMLERFTATCTGRFGDWCSIDLVEREQASSLQLPFDYAVGGRVSRAELFPDLDQIDERRFARARAAGMKAAIVVPLVGRRETLGAIIFGIARIKDPDPRWIEADLRFAEKLASRIALAIDNARLYEKERRLVEAEHKAAVRARVLANAASFFAEPTWDLIALLDPIARSIAAELRELCIIRLLSQDGRFLEPLAVHHADPELRKKMTSLVHDGAWPARDGIYGEVIASRQTAFIPIVGAELRQSFPAALRPSLDWFQPKSILIVPLTWRGEVLGALTAARGEHDRPYTFDDKTLLEELAERASMAIHNARTYENEQRARRQAEEASRAKDDFLAMVSHELRTPLNAIIGWTHMLTSGSLPAERQMRALETIQRNAEAQAQLIEDLLDISRIVTGTMRLDTSIVKLQPVIEAAIEAVGPAASAKSIQLVREIDPDAGAIQGDADRLQQIVWNLLSNAVKFTQANGRVIARLRRVGQEIEIEIADNGIGLSAAFLPHVFERFRQADEGTTRAHGGLGLGLSIVRHLVELHGGTIDAKSDGDGCGSDFIVRLPATSVSSLPASKIEARPELRSSKAADDVEPSLDGLIVLVVEDDRDTREVIVSILERADAEVLSAPSALAGLEVLGARAVDLIICDVAMPELDGYAFIGRVHASSDGKHRIPSAALTAHARAEDRAHAIAAGFDVHLAKPVEPTLLIREVARLAGR